MLKHRWKAGQLVRHDARRAALPHPRHRVIRDVIEAEELCVQWLQCVGISDARRLGSTLSKGISGKSLRATVVFDPLPIEPHELIMLHRWADYFDSQPVSFSFAGWTPDSYQVAAKLNIALARFTFAGHVEPDNDAAALLAEWLQREGLR